MEQSILSFKMFFVCSNIAAPFIFDQPFHSSDRDEIRKLQKGGGYSEVLGLIAGKVEIAKVNWDCRVFLGRRELVDAASDLWCTKRGLRSNAIENVGRRSMEVGIFIFNNSKWS